MSLFAAATDSGLVVLTCRGPAVARSGCERAASSLEVAAAPASLAALDSWTASLHRVFLRLDRRRAGARARLHSAHTAKGQVASARRLQRAYAAAADGLPTGRAPVGAERAAASLVHSLRNVRRSYRTLELALRHHSVRGYGAARRGVNRGERALQRSLRAL